MNSSFLPLGFALWWTIFLWGLGHASEGEVNVKLVGDARARTSSKPLNVD